MTDFHLLIGNWYRQNKRNLPWRNTKDPYFIWLSEIILQQTRVDQGLNYYLKFTRNYPTVEHLALASEQEVLNDWQGLGYYSRARNLHHTAKFISENLNNSFPESYEKILQLKGIGPYTAAAIASFAFNEPVAVVDGNVYRVLSRIFDIDLPIDSTEGKKAFQQLANSLIPQQNPGDFNQGIMEFGAMQCTPVNPNCTACPFTDKCLAKAHNTISQRPVKSKKTAVRDRYFYYGIFRTATHICICKRTQKDIWQHLYEFPLIETTSRQNETAIYELFEQHHSATPIRISPEVKHILSHQRIHARFAYFDQIPDALQPNAISIGTLDDYPLPRLIDRFLEENGYE